LAWFYLRDGPISLLIISSNYQLWINKKNKMKKWIKIALATLCIILIILLTIKVVGSKNSNHQEYQNEVHY